MSFNILNLWIFESLNVLFVYLDARITNPRERESIFPNFPCFPDFPNFLHFLHFPYFPLHIRQTHPRNLAIEIERIDVGHARNIIEDALYFTVGGGSMDVVLFGDSV